MGHRYNRSMMIINSFVLAFCVFQSVVLGVFLYYGLENKKNVDLLFASLKELEELKLSIDSIKDTLDAVFAPMP